MTNTKAVLSQGKRAMPQLCTHVHFSCQ